MKIDLEDYEKRIKRWTYYQGIRQAFKSEPLDAILGDLVNEVENVTKKNSEIINRVDNDPSGDSGRNSHSRAVAEADDFRDRMDEQDGGTNLSKRTSSGSRPDAVGNGRL